MASLLYSGIASALADAFTATDQSFEWKGKTFSCVNNPDSDQLVTSKTFFPSGGLPRPGDTIKVEGKTRHVLGLSNAFQTFAAGGYIEPGTAFVDDSNTPAFTIHYGAFAKG